jgi:two-component system, OmpR family, phosphate regulon response regulator PhoB
LAGLILIVEDEQDLVDTLEYNLNKDGYQTRSALNARAALELALSEPHPDLILLDIMLPDMSGIDVCKWVRRNETIRNTPIIMLTAKGEEIDRVVGFEVGADDYVVKPFSVRELVLRIKAVLRRRQTEETIEKPVLFGVLRVEVDAHRAWVADEEIRLTALEFRLLTTLLSRKGRVQSRERLLSDVWGIDADVTTRTVDTHVKRLREKLGPAGAYVETMRGVGYRFRLKDEGEST